MFTSNPVKLWKFIISISCKSNITDDAMNASRSNGSSSLKVEKYLSLLQLLFCMAICDSRHTEVQKGLLVEKEENGLKTI